MSRITNDVGQVQRAVSETIGDLTRESLALSAEAAAVETEPDKVAAASRVRGR